MAYGLLVLDTHPDPSQHGTVWDAYPAKQEAIEARETLTETEHLLVVHVTD